MRVEGGRLGMNVCECVKDDMKALGLHPEWAVFRDMWRGFISRGTSNPTERGKIDIFKINNDDDDLTSSSSSSSSFIFKTRSSK